MTPDQVKETKQIVAAASVFTPRCSLLFRSNGRLRMRFQLSLRVDPSLLLSFARLLL